MWLGSNMFVVRGQDEAAKEVVARFSEKLTLRAVILHEQPNVGHTIIEKCEAYSDVCFAVVLFTPDDVGGIRDEATELKPRARQNVIFELRYFIGKLGRRRVCALYKEVETSSNYYGVLYVPMHNTGAWRQALAKEMKLVGLNVALNKAL
jgi:predicted nucleotide-binding protein